MEQEDKEQEQKDQEQEESIASRGWVKAVFTIASALLVILIVGNFNAKAVYRRIEKDTVRKLRTFGTAELAYHDRHYKHSYGSFIALQKSECLPGNETLRNTIPYYFVTWATEDYAAQDRRQRLHPGAIWESWGSSFTIIAYPYNPARLHTFAITEEQNIREFSPEKGDKVDAVNTWLIVEYPRE
jgi:hypothetical protein